MRPCLCWGLGRALARLRRAVSGRKDFANDHRLAGAIELCRPAGRHLSCLTCGATGRPGRRRRWRGVQPYPPCRRVALLPLFARKRFIPPSPVWSVFERGSVNLIPCAPQRRGRPRCRHLAPSGAPEEIQPEAGCCARAGRVRRRTSGLMSALARITRIFYLPLKQKLGPLARSCAISSHAGDTPRCEVRAWT